MSNLPISSKYVSMPAAPVDEAEREAMVARVNAAFEAGAFDEETYRHYLDVAFAARTLGQMRPVAEALGPQATYATPGNIVASAATPGVVAPAQPPSGRLLAIVAASGIAALLILVFVIAMLL